MRLRDLEKRLSGEGWLRRHKLLVGLLSLAALAAFSMLQGLQAVHQAPAHRSSQVAHPSAKVQLSAQEKPVATLARVRVAEGALRECGDTRIVRVLEIRESGRGSETIHREQLACSRDSGGLVMHRSIARFQMGKQSFSLPESTLHSLLEELSVRIQQRASVDRKQGEVLLSEDDPGLQIWWGRGAYSEQRSKTASGSGDGMARSVTLPSFQFRGEPGQMLFNELIEAVSLNAEVETTRRVTTR